MAKIKAKRYYPTPALEKGLDILELFACTSVGLTVTEVARSLNRTVSEIFRMLLCLEERGYLTQSSNSERYQLTLRLFCLGQEHPPSKRMVMTALPIMSGLAHELGQSCHLGVLDGGHIAILVQADSPRPTGFRVKVGSVVDMMDAATGQVIFDNQTTDVSEQALEAWLRESGKHKPSDFEEHLSTIRGRGYECRASYEIGGVINVSFPVLNVQGNAIAGLTVPYVRHIGDHTGISDAIPSLRLASRQISEAFGAVPAKKEGISF